MISTPNSGDIRLVLTWGASPDILDSHVKASVSGGSNIHVQYTNKNPGGSISLDRDETNGYGPETMTIKSTHVGDKLVYYIHDYSSTGLSYRLMAYIIDSNCNQLKVSINKTTGTGG